MEARQAGLGPQDSWVVAPQKLLIHLLVLLLQAGRARETGKIRSEKPLGITDSEILTQPLVSYVNWATGAQRGRTVAQSPIAELPSHLASLKTR